MSTPALRAAETSQIVTLPPIPELFDPNFLDALVPATQSILIHKGDSTEVASNAMMDTLRSTAHKKLTTNDAPAFSSTLVSTLDAYLGLRTGISGEEVDRYLADAWAEDPDLTLRIIWSTRSIHDGKGEKELFYRAFGWLLEHHPRTAIANLHCLVDPVCQTSGKGTKLERETGGSHGNWKDLLDILALATVDELKPRLPLDPRSNFLHNYCNGNSRPAFKNNQEQEEWSRGQRVERFRRAHKCLTQKLLDNRYRALYIAVARLFADQLAKDIGGMDKIDGLPADANRDDRMALSRALTFALKWAPTPGGSHDRVTNISSAICLLLHKAQVSFPTVPKISFSVVTGLPASDMHLLRYFYQKHVLTRGRHYTCIPEPLMSTNRWSEITYSRVPSLSMNKNKEKFFVHDEERFLNYLQDVESGKKKISGATLLPHLLAIEAVQTYRQDRPTNAGKASSLTNALHKRKRRLAEAQMRVVDAQWATLLARLRESGRLDNSIAVCDVSGSMGSISHTSRNKSLFDVSPIWPAISLSLLVARLAKPPFSDSFITFSASPKFVTVKPESRDVSLGATISGMSRSDWEMNTDFNAVFLKLILPLAVAHNVPKDQMIKRIFVFSDMQFDVANIQNRGRVDVSGGWYQTSPPNTAAEWKTNHDVIAEAYAKAGYDLPELVYWDLSRPKDRHGITVPMTGERQGVALLSGYSPSLLKVFMDVEEVEEEEQWEVLDNEGQSDSERPSLTPEELMKKALRKKSYDGLVVVD